MQTSKAEQQLNRAIECLPKDMMPERDLWRGIELGIEKPETIEPSSRPSQPVWLASAASFFAVAMLGLLVWQYQAPNNDFSAQSAALVEGLSMQHESQLNTLLVKFDGQQAVTENWQQQLHELDSAADAIKAALKEDPANKALLQMLQHVYQQQIDLVERVHSPKWQQI